MGTPPPIEIASLSMPDTLILMVMALVFFGPRRLPQLGRQMANSCTSSARPPTISNSRWKKSCAHQKTPTVAKKEEERLRALAPAPVPATVAVEAAADIGAASTEDIPPCRSPHQKQKRTFPHPAAFNR